MASGQRSLLIVGGLGYLGSRLAAALGDRARVTVTSRSLTPLRERWLSQQGSRVSWLPFDSARHDRLDTGDTFDCILHLATPSAAEAGQQPDKSRELALRSLAAALGLCQAGRASALIHFSTFHVYGAPGRACYSEETASLAEHPYGQIHRQCEQAIEQATPGIPVFVVRPTNIVGAPAHGDLGVQASLVFLDLCRQAVQNRRLKLRSDGQAYRDFVTMADAIQAVCLLIAAAREAPPVTRVLNLSQGQATRLDALANQIQSEAQHLLQAAVPLELGDAADAFQAPFHVANDRLRQLGWQPSGDCGREIRETLQFFQPAHEA